MRLHDRSRRRKGTRCGNHGREVGVADGGDCALNGGWRRWTWPSWAVAGETFNSIKHLKFMKVLKIELPSKIKTWGIFHNFKELRVRLFRENCDVSGKYFLEK